MDLPKPWYFSKDSHSMTVNQTPSMIPKYESINKTLYIGKIAMVQYAFAS